MTSLGNHPRIIQFFAIVRDEKNFQIMIVMEFLEGASLADKLKDQKPLPDSSVLKYLVQILEGVSFIHRKGIYHSDIKPANILFTCGGRPEDQRLRNSSRRPVGDDGVGHVVAHSGRLSVFVSGATGGRRAERRE